MKTILEKFELRFLLTILLVFSFQFGESQNSFPLAIDSVKWNVLWCQFNFVPIGTSNGTAHQMLYKDTLLCGYTYSKPYNNENYFMRSDSNRVFARKSNICTEKEYLTYDFSLQTGDSAFVLIDPFGNATDTILITVAQIDTLIDFGISRKRMKIHCSNNYLNDTYWIRGIGSTYGPFYSFECIFDGCEICGNTLMCVDSNKIQIYQTTAFQTCDTAWVTAIDEVKFSNQEIDLFPNPANHRVTVKSKNTIAKLEVYSIIGEKIVEVEPNLNSVEIDLRSYSEGMYVVVLSINGNQYIQKFLKTRKN